MNPLPSSRAERRAWAAAFVWTAFVYTFIPFARAFQRAVYEWAGRAVFSYAVYACVGAGLAAAAWMVARHGRSLSARRWLVLLAVAGLYAAGTHQLRESPEEALHFVQYGVLSLLFHRALGHRYGDRGLYARAFLLAALAGVVDEFIQWIVPRRIFDFRDMGINAAAALLMQLALAGGWERAAERPAASARTHRACALTVSALAALLTLASLATPARMARLHAWKPGLPVLEEHTIEYGYRHRVPGVGVFFSRLTEEGLRAQDAARAEEAGRLLRAGGDDELYETFIRRHTAVTDPFLHELRVHLFRRDRYWRDARAKRSDPAAHERLITVAFCEQAILEHAFGRSLAASGLDWPPELRERARAAARPGRYVSAVSAQLVTRLSPRQLPALLAGVALVGLLAARYHGRRARREPV